LVLSEVKLVMADREQHRSRAWRAYIYVQTTKSFVAKRGSSGHEEPVAALAAPGLRVVLEREADAGLDGDVHRPARVADPAPPPARRRRRPRPHQLPPPRRDRRVPGVLLQRSAAGAAPPARRRAHTCRTGQTYVFVS
jgi:hypothetical protein